MKTYELFTKDECKIILDDILSNYKSGYVCREFETDKSLFYKIAHNTTEKIFNINESTKMI